MNPEGELAPRKGWWSRNWLWAVPSGCLGLLLSCGCLGALFVTLTISGSGGVSVVTQAIERAKQSPEVQQALGEPINPTAWGFQGSIHSGTDGGSANFSLPLQGSRAEGTLRVRASQQGDTWTYTQLQVDVPDQASVDVLSGTRLAPEPPDTARPDLPDVEPLPDERPKKKGSSDVEL